MGYYKVILFLNVTNFHRLQLYTREISAEEPAGKQTSIYEFSLEATLSRSIGRASIGVR
jgi:hypothetical protein